jgi:hypothetical protein
MIEVAVREHDGFWRGVWSNVFIDGAQNVPGISGRACVDQQPFFAGADYVAIGDTGGYADYAARDQFTFRHIHLPQLLDAE